MIYFLCFSPFYIVKIPNSSLLLVVVENITSEDVHPKFVTSPQDVIYEGVKNPCHKLILNDLERRPLGGCYNEHPMVSVINLKTFPNNLSFQESTIKECGRATQLNTETLFLILNVLLLLSF